MSVCAFDVLCVSIRLTNQVACIENCTYYFIQSGTGRYLRHVRALSQ